MFLRLGPRWWLLWPRTARCGSAVTLTHPQPNRASAQMNSAACLGCAYVPSLCSFAFGLDLKPAAEDLARRQITDTCVSRSLTARGSG